MNFFYVPMPAISNIWLKQYLKVFSSIVILFLIYFYISGPTIHLPLKSEARKKFTKFKLSSANTFLKPLSISYSFLSSLTSDFILLFMGVYYSSLDRNTFTNYEYFMESRCSGVQACTTFYTSRISKNTPSSWRYFVISSARQKSLRSAFSSKNIFFES